ncbi:HIPL1 protein-like [Macadamia integrifolia]|uniref:HIPL1 protein-like n=1 Tax=Macadamia integrifolia TaxID=60698 RepID=UPI001C4FA680|nr:HIPL1 protein-like [Macadamia integrifolia]
MSCVLGILCFFGLLLLLPGLSSSHPLCTDSTAPLTLKTPLTFCPYKGSVCCNATQDLQLQTHFQSMNISSPTCASLMKSILCATCDQFSAELFTIDSGPRSFPVLCNSTISVGSSQSNGAANNFCGMVWDTCYNVSMLNSPFASLQGSQNVNSTSSKLADLWQSKSDFCKAVGGASSNDAVCFDGQPVSLNNTEILQPPSGMCLEKVGNGSYIDMIGHPDGSNRVFLTEQQGKIWLATVPDVESGATLGPSELSPFLDLSNIISFDYDLGLMGIAFHPNFVKNGRFFVSFNCDKSKWDGCSGQCSCNKDVNCIPSEVAPSNDGSPCQFFSVISEFSANGTTSQFSLTTSSNQLEVRRIFTMGLPYTSHHGGQILFGPDGYLYFMMGDGGSAGDPYNFSQNKKSLLGKIMRFDVDNFPSKKQINALGLWGNYSIPQDNPVSEDNELRPEIYAMGFRNPWRCAFDPERPSYFLCADVGEDKYEEVDLITKGGNYGWRVYEGPYAYNPHVSPGGNTSANSINPIFPVMGYDHSTVNQNLQTGGAAIIGGYFYRSMSDPCTYGRYIYADFYAEAIWGGIENPENSGNFTSNQIPFTCAHDSPMQCKFTEGSSLPALGYINSFGEDNKKDVYIFTTNGVYRIVRPSRCNYMCLKENVSSIATPSPSNSPSSGSSLRKQYYDLVLLFSLLMLLLGVIF